MRAIFSISSSGLSSENNRPITTGLIGMMSSLSQSVYLLTVSTTLRPASQSQATRPYAMPATIYTTRQLRAQTAINHKGDTVTSDGYPPDRKYKGDSMSTVNSFTFNNALLKSVKDYDNVIKGIVQSRQTEYLPDGSVRSRFIASRQVTIQDPSIIAQLRPMLADNSEFVVNLSGYLTTTVREDKGQTKWYDNQIVTTLEFLS